MLIGVSLWGHATTTSLVNNIILWVDINVNASTPKRIHYTKVSSTFPFSPLLLTLISTHIVNIKDPTSLLA